MDPIVNKIASRAVAASFELGEIEKQDQVELPVVAWEAPNSNKELMSGTLFK